MRLYQVLKFLHSKRNQQKGNVANGKKIFPNHVSGKGLKSKIYKEFTQPNSKKKKKKSDLKMGRREFPSWHSG